MCLRFIQIISNPSSETAAKVLIDPPLFLTKPAKRKWICCECLLSVQPRISGSKGFRPVVM